MREKDGGHQRLLFCLFVCLKNKIVARRQIICVVVYVFNHVHQLALLWVLFLSFETLARERVVFGDFECALFHLEKELHFKEESKDYRILNCFV